MNRSSNFWLTFLGVILVIALVLPTSLRVDGVWNTDGFVATIFADDDDDDDDWDDDDWEDDDDCDDDDDWDDDDCYFVPEPVDTNDAPVPNQAIVQLSADTDIDAFVENHGVTILGSVPGHTVLLLGLDPVLDDQTQVLELLNDERVVWSELNFTSQAPEGRRRYFFTSTSTAGSFVEAASLPAEFQFTSTEACADGSGLTVAILDTGVDTSHPHFAESTFTGGWNTVDDTDDVGDYANGVDEDGDGQVDEMVGHGTHVAGSIVMIAPETEILPYKVLNSDGTGTAFSVTAGIYRAVDDGANVINLSLGTTHDSEAIRHAIAYAHSEGVVIVAAAGNSNVYTPTEFPAAVEEVISVASTDATGNKAWYSNFHESIDISAPGDDVASAYPDGQYILASGTSMSTPLVSGTVLLAMERNPDLTPQQIEELIKTESTPLSLVDPLLEGLMGAGEVNVDASLGCDIPEPEPTPRGHFPMEPVNIPA